jgi:hypothetical protein
LRADAEAVRRELVAHLSEVLPPAPPHGSLRLGAAALAVAAVAVCLLFGPGRGVERGAMRARNADRAARAGEVQKARAQWSALWREGGREAGLAARLAWAELSAGSISPASLWALRGDREEPRDPALSWVIGQIRETGGLAGFIPARLPVRRIEWAIAALVIGVMVALSWPRRWPTAGAVALLACCALAYPLEGWVAERATRGIVRSGVRLEGTNIELEPGQVVTLLEREGIRARAAAGRGVSGWVPLSAVQTLDHLQ